MHGYAFGGEGALAPSVFKAFDATTKKGSLAI